MNGLKTNHNVFTSGFPTSKRGSEPTIEDKQCLLGRDFYEAMQFGDLNHKYRSSTPIRATAVVVLAVAIASLAIISTGGFKDFPRRVAKFFNTPVSPTKLGVIIGGSLFSIGMMGVIFYRAVYGKELLFEDAEVKKTLEEFRAEFPAIALPKTKGSIWSQNQDIIPCYLSGQRYASKKSGEEQLKATSLGAFQMLDTSTLTVNTEGNLEGIAFTYNHKKTGDAEQIALATFYGHVIVPISMVYNVIRAVATPLFMLGKNCVDAANNRPLTFKAQEFPKQVGKALWNVISAPFYMLHFIFGGILTWINPLAGRKYVSLIERDYNHGVPQTKSFWLGGGGFQKGFKWKGFYDPKENIAYYTTGCYGITSISLVKNGLITKTVPLHRIGSLRLYTPASLPKFRSLTFGDTEATLSYEFSGEIFSKKIDINPENQTQQDYFSRDDEGNYTFTSVEKERLTLYEYEKYKKNIHAWLVATALAEHLCPTSTTI